MFCKNCGKQLNDDVKFCKFCGQVIAIGNPDKTEIPADNPNKEQSLNNNKNNGNKTISYLNSKAWYRFIKVVYLFLFLVAILIANGIIMDGGINRLDLDKSTIYCKDGKSFSLKQGYPYFSNSDFKNGFNYQSFSTGYSTKYESEEIAKKCSSLSFQPVVKSSVNLFDIKPVFTYNEFIKYFLLANLIILLVFEAIKRCFYYVFLGSLRPPK